MNIRVTATLLCAAVVICGGAAMALPTIANPSFEGDGDTFGVPGYGDIPSWTNDSASSGIASDNDGGFGHGAGTAPDGTYFAFQQGPGTISQELTDDLTDGVRYAVTFHARERESYDPVNLTVLVGNKVVHHAPNFNPGGWQEITARFWYEDGQGTTLAFESESATGEDAALLLDNVQIRSSEPGEGMPAANVVALSLLALAVGAAGIANARRKRA